MSSYEPHDDAVDEQQLHLLEMGTTALRQGRIWEAEKAFDAALRLSAESDVAARSVALRAAQALLTAGRPVKAAAFYRRLVLAANGAGLLDWRSPIVNQLGDDLFFALLPRASGIYLVPMLPLDAVRLVQREDEQELRARVGLFIQDEYFQLTQAVAEFTALINGADVKESDLQSFFERNPMVSPGPRVPALEPPSRVGGQQARVRPHPGLRYGTDQHSTR